MSVPLRTDPASLARMRANVATLEDPVAFARRYLRLRGFHHQHRDFDELLCVAAMAIVKAGLVYVNRPDGDGVSFTTWAYLYMDRDVLRELQRDRCLLAELEHPDHPRVEGDWLRFDSGVDWYHRVELRVDLQRWADLARLSDHHRRVVELFAHHAGTIVRHTHARGHDTIGDEAGSYRLAFRHMRHAAITGQRRDDRWTRARDSQRLLHELAATAGPTMVICRVDRTIKLTCANCGRTAPRKVFAIDAQRTVWCVTCFDHDSMAGLP